MHPVSKLHKLWEVGFNSSALDHPSLLTCHYSKRNGYQPTCSHILMHLFLHTVSAFQTFRQPVLQAANRGLELTLSTHCVKAPLLATDFCLLPSRIGISSTPFNALVKILSGCDSSESRIAGEGLVNTIKMCMYRLTNTTQLLHIQQVELPYHAMDSFPGFLPPSYIGQKQLVFLIHYSKVTVTVNRMCQLCGAFPIPFPYSLYIHGTLVVQG